MKRRAYRLFRGHLPGIAIRIGTDWSPGLSGILSIQISMRSDTDGGREYHLTNFQ